MINAFLKTTRDKPRLKTSIYTMLMFLLLSLGGCSSSTDENYYQVFDKIKTDQFIRSYGFGGIYWVSNDAVILDGVVDNASGEPEHGVYLVTMDGVYTRLVEVLDYPGWTYCYSEGVVYLKNDTASFNVLVEPAGIEIKKKIRMFKPKNSSYSPIRCQFAKIPGNTGGYIALSNQDGFIRNTYWSEGEKLQNAYIVDENDNIVAAVDVKAGSFFGSPRYLEDRDAYFGYRKRQNCVSLWWLYRDSWNTTTEKRCFGGWASAGSISLLSTKVGLFISDHSMKGYKTYLFAGDKEFKLERVSARREALSPDGCRVAYASGEIGYGKNRFSQILKIFDACKFIEDQGR